MSRINRVQTTAATGIGFWVAGGLQPQESKSPNEQLQFGAIGVDGKGRSDARNAARHGAMVAICDVDDNKLNAAKNVAERIRKRFEEQEFSIITDEKLNISVSIGVSQFKRGEKMEGFVKRTDNALYIAKQKGKNMTYASQ